MMDVCPFRTDVDGTICISSFTAESLRYYAALPHTRDASTLPLENNNRRTKRSAIEHVAFLYKV
jgi:hypothetical protein